MSLVERDSVEYTISQDELMLKELERRDGIYSFIFHELERPKDGGDNDNSNSNSSCNSNQIANECVKSNQVIIVNDSMPPGSTIMTKEFVTHTSSSSSSSSPSPREYFQAHTDPIFSTHFWPSINHQVNKATPLLKSTSFEFTRAANPYFTSNSFSPLTTSCRFLSHTKFYDFISSNAIRVRIATPRFSNIYVPMVRNRHHVLKETNEYKNSELNIGCTPDLRSLFPLDPDVHAPFAPKTPPEESDIKVDKESDDV